MGIFCKNPSTHAGQKKLRKETKQVTNPDCIQFTPGLT
jgi:hypothetical protein